MIISVPEELGSAHRHTRRQGHHEAGHSSMLIPVILLVLAGVGISCLIVLLILHHHTRRRRRVRHTASDLAIPRSLSDESFVSGARCAKVDQELHSPPPYFPEQQTHLPSPPLTPPVLRVDGEKVQALTTAHSLVAFPATLSSSLSAVPLRPRAMTSPGRVHRTVMGFEMLAASGGEAKVRVLDAPLSKSRQTETPSKRMLPTPASSQSASPVLLPIRISASHSMLALLKAAGLSSSTGVHLGDESRSIYSDEDRLETASDVDRCDSGTVELAVVSSYEDSESEEDNDDYEPFAFPAAPTSVRRTVHYEMEPDDSRLAYLSDSPTEDGRRDSLLSSSVADATTSEDEYGEPTLKVRLSGTTRDSSCSDRTASLPSELDRPETAQSQVSVPSSTRSASAYSGVTDQSDGEDDQLTRLSPLPISPVEGTFLMHRISDGRYPSFVPFVPSPVSTSSTESPTLATPPPSTLTNTADSRDVNTRVYESEEANVKYDPSATRTFMFGSSARRNRVASPALPSLATGIGAVGLGLSLGLGSRGPLRNPSEAGLEAVYEQPTGNPVSLTRVLTNDGIYSPSATRSRRVSHRPGLSLPGGVGRSMRPTLTLLPPDSHRHASHQRSVSESSSCTSDMSRSSSPLFDVSAKDTPTSSACPTPTFPPPITTHMHHRANLTAESSVLVKIYYSPTAPPPRQPYASESHVRTAKETIKFRLPRTAVFGELCIKAWEKLGVAVRLVMYDGNMADAGDWEGDSVSGREVGAGEWRDLCNSGCDKVYFWARDA